MVARVDGSAQAAVMAFPSAGDGAPLHSPSHPCAGLFPRALGRAWEGLPPAVRTLHGGRSLRASGRARVSGDMRWCAKWVRAIARLPPPADTLELVLEIDADATGERWLRHFGTRPMCSTLAASARHPGALEERLGPARLTFGFEVRDARLHWRAREVRVFGIALPLRWFQRMNASCGEYQGRYVFDIDVHLPLVGWLVAYSGWLEPVDGAA
ncbi:MAG TPA: DUF4166 domain-containing protein [Dokdonella sp.]